MATLEDYLKNWHLTGCPFSKDYGKCVNGHCYKERQKLIEEIQAYIDKEIIGSDGEVTRHERANGIVSVDLTQSYYNALRAEQRAKLKEQ